MWALVNALFLVVLVAVGWFFFGGKSLSLKKCGLCIGWKKTWRTILLALSVVAGAFSIVFIADFFFKVDFRTWVIPFKAFTADKIGLILIYLPFFLAFYVIHSISVNSFNNVRMGPKEWINVAVLALATVLGALFIVVIQYGTFLTVGKSWTELNFPTISNIAGILLFPILVYFPLAAVLDRLTYKVTKNPYLGGLIFGLFMTIMASTNTLTYLP
jgi:hypothetical protein